MQLFASAPVKTLNQPFEPMAWKGLWQFLNRRIFPGFRIGEALAWLLFHISWPLLLGTIYQITGKFSNPNFMTLSKYMSVQAFVVSGKALCLLPIWWLYFVKLKGVPLSRKLLLHLLTSALYITMCISFLYVALTYVLEFNYTRNDRINDIYGLLLNYCSYFALFHAYNFWLHTKEQMKKEQALKELAYQSEIKALKSQVEPHFLFNTLNSISASVPQTLESTRVLIAQLADTFRYALRVSEDQFVQLRDELDFVKTWLALEKQRFGQRLTIHFEVDPKATGVMIPPMLIQPLIENALKHGIAPRIEGGSVTVKCELQDDHVHITVGDTGVGYPGNLNEIMNKGVGLSNIAKRLRLLYDQQLQVTRQTMGLTFSFKIPLQISIERLAIGKISS